jgi:tetratricopeptide (TPR) repeat protein
MAVAIGMTPAVAQTPATSELSGSIVSHAAGAATKPTAICSGDDAAPAKAMILPGYGKGGFAIRTESPMAQAYLDNGMQLGHAFAHKASIAAFTRAAELDPRCAMCLWGEAWASGPTINYPIEKKDVALLAEMVAHAGMLLAPDAPQKERQLIAALALRYDHGGGAGRGDKAFAAAMVALAKAYPLDNEIQTIAADAIMIVSSNSGKFNDMDRAMALLEPVLQRDPDYTPAIHFYIHATEIAGVPAYAEPYADRLIGDAPNASHLIHMPSHTWYHIGRYQDAADANVRAAAIGRDNAKRLGMAQPDGVWQLPYHMHNVKYGISGALMAGDAKSALLLSDPIMGRITASKGKENPGSQMTYGLAYMAQGRFADRAKVTALPEPRAELPYARAFLHYARGEAAARAGDAAAVKAEAAAMPDRIAPQKDDWGAGYATRMMRIERLVLEGRAAMIEQRPDDAVIAFRKAALLQENKDFLEISDPPAFWYMVRRDLGAALLAAGRPEQAIAEIDQSLKLMPRDAIALATRSAAEARLGRTARAASDRAMALSLWHGDRASLGLPGAVRLASR